MTPEQYQRVCELLEQVCEIPEAERAPLLAQIAQEEPVVWEEVSSLLDYLGDSSPFEPRPVDDVPFTLGKYEVVAQLGAGGMGIVYDALQREPERSVALKIIHPGIASESALRRFQLEALLLARLQHPGIAQIYETGTFSEVDVGESGPVQRFLGQPVLA